MSFQPIHLGAAALLGCLTLTGGNAFAQAAAPAAPAAQPQAPQPQGPVKVEMQATQTGWTKVCGKGQGNAKELCFTTRDFTTAPDQPPPIALAIYEVKGDDTRIVRVLLPVGFLLKPGVRFSIDKGAAQDGAYEFCMPNGCFAEGKVKPATIESMKKGTVLNVVAKNMANNEVTFTLPLSGFGKAFDGAPVDPKVLEAQQQAQQQELQRQLEERAKQQRQTLEQQGAPGATPAPAAPAAPKP